MLCIHKDNFISSFTFWMLLLIFSCISSLARASKTILNFLFGYILLAVCWALWKFRFILISFIKFGNFGAIIYSYNLSVPSLFSWDYHHAYIYLSVWLCSTSPKDLVHFTCVYSSDNFKWSLLKFTFLPAQVCHIYSLTLFLALEILFGSFYNICLFIL